MVDVTESVVAVAEAATTVATGVVADEHRHHATDPHETHGGDDEPQPFRVRRGERQRENHGASR